jgi:hypothetical protein
LARVGACGYDCSPQGIDPRSSSSKLVTSLTNLFFLVLLFILDRLCGLVVRVAGYRSRYPGFDSRRYQISLEVVGLERGPISLVRITEELLEWTSSGSGSRKSRLTAVGIRCADHTTPSAKVGTNFVDKQRSLGRHYSHGV